MLRRLGSHIHNQWMGALALFLVLTGGVASAANTVFSTDIVDGEVKNADIATNAVRTGKILNENLTGADIAGNTLTGADVDESTLAGLASYSQGTYEAGVLEPAGTLLSLPGLGTLSADCTTNASPVYLQLDAAAADAVEWSSDLEWAAPSELPARHGSMASNGTIFLGDGGASSLFAGDTVHLQLSSGTESASITVVVPSADFSGCVVTADSFSTSS